MLEKHLDEFVMAYLNNIIIYLDLEEEYKKHIKWVLERLYNKNILIVIKKLLWTNFWMKYYNY